MAQNRLGGGCGARVDSQANNRLPCACSGEPVARARHRCTSAVGNAAAVRRSRFRRAATASMKLLVVQAPEFDHDRETRTAGGESYGPAQTARYGDARTRRITKVL